IGFKFNFSGINFSYIDGFVGQIPFSTPADSFNIDLFKNSLAGSIQLSDPKVQMNISNSFGLPIKLKFDQFDAVLANGQRLKIKNVDTILAYPTSRLQPAQTSVLAFDRNSSNIQTA